MFSDHKIKSLMPVHSLSGAGDQKLHQRRLCTFILLAPAAVFKNGIVGVHLIFICLETSSLF